MHENVGEKRLAVRVDWLGSDASVERDGNDHRESPSNVRRKRSSQSGKSEAFPGPESYR